jgi:hypothetical protein
MDIASISHRYLDRFTAQHGHTLNRDQWSAFNAILGCRTEQYGKVHLSCSRCPSQSSRYQSCGHRSCNQCQHYNTTQWLERQMTKLLPVEYFMVTFTLPAELRGLARYNQKLIYGLMFDCAISTLNTFAKNEPGIKAELASTVVLHTHSRTLEYHPHVHMIVPGGWVNKNRHQWHKLKGNYLFNGKKLAAVFRGKLLDAIKQAGLTLPKTPKHWVAHCKQVGKGLPALQYLSRYLYRGVIDNQRIISDDGTHITFEYTDGESGQTRTRSLAGEDFIKLILQHTLPKGFRRVRDYGWLHGNAKRLLKTIQWVLQVAISNKCQSVRPSFKCAQCQAVMAIVGFSRPRPRPG